MVIIVYEKIQNFYNRDKIVILANMLHKESNS